MATATAPVKSQQPLHNFSLPAFLSWGGATSCSPSPSLSPAHPHPHPHFRPPTTTPTPTPTPNHGRCASDHARPAAPVPSPRPPSSSRPRRGSTRIAQLGAAGRRRPKRAANPPPPALPSRNGKSFPDAAYGAFGGDKENYARPPQPKSVRLRGFAEEGERKEKRKFWISLSKEEIEEDIFTMTRSRPAWRPRKRPKNEQKQLDIVFPGLWLVGLTADAYRVAEAPAKAYIAEIEGVPEPEVVMLESLWRFISTWRFHTSTRGKI